MYPAHPNRNAEEGERQSDSGEYERDFELCCSDLEELFLVLVGYEKPASSTLVKSVLTFLDKKFYFFQAIYLSLGLSFSFIFSSGDQ